MTAWCLFALASALVALLLSVAVWSRGSPLLSVGLLGVVLMETALAYRFHRQESE